MHLKTTLKKGKLFFNFFLWFKMLRLLHKFKLYVPALLSTGQWPYEHRKKGGLRFLLFPNATSVYLLIQQYLSSSQEENISYFVYQILCFKDFIYSAKAIPLRISDKNFLTEGWPFLNWKLSTSLLREREFIELWTKGSL